MRQFFNIKTGLALLLLVSKLAGAQQNGWDKQLVLEKEKLAVNRGGVLIKMVIPFCKNDVMSLVSGARTAGS